MARIVLAFVLALLSAVPTVAQNRKTCDDFTTQAQAQRVLVRDPSDPNGLDSDKNGIACEELPAGGGNRRAPAPDPPAKESTSADRFNCENLLTQARAQRILERDPADPNQLDANGDGQACEEFFAETTAAAPAEPAAPPSLPETGEDLETLDVARLPSVILEDIDCVAFATQEEAQAVLDRDSSDPHNLDPNHDGVACSSLPSRVSVTRLPATGTGTMATILAATEPPACSTFTSQIWAQSIFETDPTRFAALDPDGNGLAVRSCRPVPRWADGWTRSGRRRAGPACSRGRRRHHPGHCRGIEELGASS